MTQYELNRQIAKQTGESIAEISRLGFTILTELPQDSDVEPVPAKALPRTAAAA